MLVNKSYCRLLLAGCKPLTTLPNIGLETSLKILRHQAGIYRHVPLFYRFGGKEDYMGFMNGFVEKEFVNMRRFLDDISVSYKLSSCLIKLKSEKLSQISVQLMRMLLSQSRHRHCHSRFKFQRTLRSFREN